MFTLSASQSHLNTLFAGKMRGEKQGRHFNEEAKEEMGLRQYNKGALLFFLSS